MTTESCNWVWALRPLANDHSPNLMCSGFHQPGAIVQTYRNARSGALVVGKHPFEFGDGAKDWVIGPRYYCPSEEDLALVRMHFPNLRDPADPPWLQVETRLIAAGRSIDDVMRMTAPSLLAVLAKMPNRASAAHREEWLAKAMLMVRDHPDWSDAEIARRVSMSPTTLSRSREFKAAATQARGSKTDRPQGYVTRDPATGVANVEAVAPPAASTGDHSDQGKPIPGSRYHREYCAGCGDAIKVPKDKVGTKPRCERCEK